MTMTKLYKPFIFMRVI